MTIDSVPGQYNDPMARFMREYVSLAVWLLGAIALIVSSGYSLGAAMLLLGSVWLLFKRPDLHLSLEDGYVMAALVAYAGVGMLEAGWDQQGVSGFDLPIRFLLAVPAMLLVMAYPPRLAWLWSGVAVGAIASGSWAGWQKLIVGVDRAGGYTYVIQYGNLNMLLGIFCMAGLGWAVVQPRRLIWFTLLGVGAVAGMLGSLFSGSRGGWVGLPFVFLVLYQAYGKHLPWKLKATAMAVIVAGATAVYSLPQTGVQSRVMQAFGDVEQYLEGEGRTSSLGARFEMWKGASLLVAEKPLTGWGDNGYQRGMQALADEGVIHPYVTRYDHAHNEFIDALAKRGILGLAVLLVLYLVPMKLFAKRLGDADLEKRSLAAAGVLLSVAYIDFGLSQAFLTHNSGVMMFAFWLAVLWGSLMAYYRTQDPV